jgi:iron complex transport system ATP-binding protein
MNGKDSILLDLKNVSIIRAGKRVLRSVHWTTRRGEHWFIMGNNGSGKTTLLEIVLGYLWPSDGEVTVLGERFGRTFLPDLRKRIGYVAPWVFKRVRPFVPVSDVIASGEDASIGLCESPPADLKRRITKQARFFGCAGFLERPFGQLSSGQQLKTILARAMVHSPEILILDEPFSLLDIGSRAGIYKLIEKLGKTKNGPQIILVTHHLEDIRPVFTHGLFLKDGHIAEHGVKQRLLNIKLVAKTFNIPLNHFRNQGVRL